MISVDSMRALWAAVLYRAVEDAKRTGCKNDNDFIEHMKVREAAIKWIFHKNEDIRGFDGLCQYLNIDANTIRRSDVMQEALNHYMIDMGRMLDIYDQRKDRAICKSQKQRERFLAKKALKELQEEQRKAAFMEQKERRLLAKQSQRIEKIEAKKNARINRNRENSRNLH